MGTAMILAACVLVFAPSPPAHATDVHLAAWEAWKDEVAAVIIHERQHCIEDLNGPYIVPQRRSAAPRATQPPAPVSRGAGSDVIDWTPYVSGYDWPVATALRVIACESIGSAGSAPLGDRLAVNPSSGASGGWQFMPSWHNQVNPFDPSDATRFAYVLWQDGGGSFHAHWYPSEHCWG